MLHLTGRWPQVSGSGFSNSFASHTYDPFSRNPFASHTYAKTGGYPPLAMPPTVPFRNFPLFQRIPDHPWGGRSQ